MRNHKLAEAPGLGATAGPQHTAKLNGASPPRPEVTAQLKLLFIQLTATIAAMFTQPTALLRCSLGPQHCCAVHSAHIIAGLFSKSSQLLR